LLTGYDTVSNLRIQRQRPEGEPPSFAERPFICVARLVPKKNLFALLDAYALYRQQVTGAARRLVVVGDGPLDVPLRQYCEKLGLADLVDMPGFLDTSVVVAMMARALALVLVSTEEQWGLVVNEAVALDLPVIVSERVGARSELVINLVNGYVVPPNHVEAIAQAMLRIGADEAAWQAMRLKSREAAAHGDVNKFVQSVEQMIDLTIR